MMMPGIPAWKRFGVAAIGLLSLVGATGCQVDVSGQTLPSPYWLTDDVQYFAPGTEFKLSREAAAMQAEADAEAAGAVGAAPAPTPAMGGAPVPMPPGAAPPAPAAVPIVP